ncbi:homoserine kinase [Sporolactobacillus vineae]|uniref:homoserine kinase n=1 Tax=Sporolactobacillus vineae TaxID=444463 RepID=UPI000288B052|nr:homoserine kinase [Sporolactobacillus vineae]
MTYPAAFQIKVPGSTANLGPGFDSIGMAVNRFLTLNAVHSDKWAFTYLDQPDFCPPIEENLIYQTAKQVADAHQTELPCYSVDVRSAIPLARGLGSSGAAIVAGIELADYALGLQLGEDEKAWLACKAEGHPDNVTPSLYGGLVVSSQSTEEVNSVRLPAPDFDFVTVIPNYNLKTSEARSVLPTSLSFRSAIEGSSVANVLICALLSHNGELAGKMMESDRFHQPFRKALIPEMPQIIRITHESGGYGTFLSGAGPTVMSLASRSKSALIRERLADAFPDYECVVLSPVSEGVRVTLFTHEQHPANH